jgi:hypothetical protein
MKDHAKIELLYFVNTILLFVHEEDSAYWREWDLFALPFGIQGFLLLDMVLIAAGLLGFRYLVQQRRIGLWFALAQAGCGVLAFVLHGVFILNGHPEFTLPVSELVLILILAVSIGEAILSIQHLRRGGESATESLAQADHVR